jgi:hypothetical protein
MEASDCGRFFSRFCESKNRLFCLLCSKRFADEEIMTSQEHAALETNPIVEADAIASTWY